jgi:23S rRNA (guanine745-N1)-methyltransferase
MNLLCPICGEQLQSVGKQYVCPHNHSFDVARQGYVNLLTVQQKHSLNPGDTREQVLSRREFLEAGFYEPIANALIQEAKELGISGQILDVGCGEGYYSDRIAAEFDRAFVFGADLSKHAVHRASVRRNMRGGSNCFYAVASVFSLPIRASAADGMLSMFAPVAEAECLRVLKDNGILIIGAAGDRHMYDLKEAIYDEVHINEDRADLPVSMSLVEKTNVTYRITIDNNNDIQRLFGMTPYKYRTSAKSIELLNGLKHLETEINVDFYVYKK